MIPTSAEKFRELLEAPEGNRLEFKEASHQYDFDKLINYCVAIANEGGGKIVLGVSDRRPRNVVGTGIFPEPGQTEARLHSELMHRIPIEEFLQGGKRVLIVHVPARLPGTAWQYRGRYLKRAGDALIPLGEAELRAIFAETGPDFTAEIVPGASVSDLEFLAVQEFQNRWQKKNPSLKIGNLDTAQVLADAEALNRCGFIERSGQGVNLMIEQAVRQTKPLPDFSRSAAHEVFLTLAGTVQNPAFLRYIERLGEDALSSFQTLDFLTLDALARGWNLTLEMKTRLPDLIETGAVESRGRGRGQRFFLSRALYEAMGSPGTHTRQVGLDYETNKELLLKHLRSCPDIGAKISELEQVLPAQSRASILRMLQDLRKEGRVELSGGGRSMRWQLRQNFEADANPEV